MKTILFALVLLLAPLAGCSSTPDADVPAEEAAVVTDDAGSTRPEVRYYVIADR